MERKAGREANPLDKDSQHICWMVMAQMPTLRHTMMKAMALMDFLLDLLNRRPTTPLVT